MLCGVSRADLWSKKKLEFVVPPLLLLAVFGDYITTVTTTTTTVTTPLTAATITSSSRRIQHPSLQLPLPVIAAVWPLKISFNQLRLWKTDGKWYVFLHLSRQTKKVACKQRKKVKKKNPTFYHFWWKGALSIKSIN